MIILYLKWYKFSGHIYRIDPRKGGIIMSKQIKRLTEMTKSGG